jgi:hypothetical protein
MTVYKANVLQWLTMVSVDAQSKQRQKLTSLYKLYLQIHCMLRSAMFPASTAGQYTQRLEAATLEPTAAMKQAESRLLKQSLGLPEADQVEAHPEDGQPDKLLCSLFFISHAPLAATMETEQAETNSAVSEAAVEEMPASQQAGTRHPTGHHPDQRASALRRKHLADISHGADWCDQAPSRPTKAWWVR